MNVHDLNEIFVEFHSFVCIFLDFNDFVRAFFVRVGCFVRVPLSASFVLFGCSYSLSIFVRVFYSGISCFCFVSGFCQCGFVRRVVHFFSVASAGRLFLKKVGRP